MPIVARSSVRILAALVVLVALLPIGCNGESPIAPSTVYPIHHDHPSWAPSSRVAYLDRGIVTVNADGSYIEDPDLRGVWIAFTQADSFEFFLRGGDCPAWSPDTSRIAVTVDGALFVATVPDGNLTLITAGHRDHHPAWSPDGTRLCWYRSSGDEAGLWIHDTIADSTYAIPAGEADMQDM